MSRWRAFRLHLVFSVAVTALVAALIYFIWYPVPYFEVSGGFALMIVVSCVNLAIGPFLTLLVFKPGKKGLRFDMAVIIMLQLAALGYGMKVITEARPVFVVAAVDRLILVSANQIDDADLAAGSAPEFRTRSWLGPRLVGALPPQFGQEALDSVMSGLAGKDIERFPKNFVPYSQVVADLLARSRTLADTMKESEQDADAVQHFLAASGTDAGAYRSLPVRGRAADYTMVIGAETGKPLTALAIDPW